MNKINLATDLQDLTCEQAATIQGGAAVELYDDINFDKPMVYTDFDYSYVGDTLNDRVSSIRINEGTWNFYTDANFEGNVVTLKPGSYPFVPNVGLPNDSLSSFKKVA